MLRGLLFVLTLVPLASAEANATNATNATTDDGLGGPAIAGIIIGSLLVASVIGVAVWVRWYRPAVKPRVEFPCSGASGSAPTTTAKAGGNHLPMVAVRVNVDDDL